MYKPILAGIRDNFRIYEIYYFLKNLPELRSLYFHYTLINIFLYIGMDLAVDTIYDFFLGPQNKIFPSIKYYYYLFYYIFWLIPFLIIRFFVNINLNLTIAEKVCVKSMNSINSINRLAAILSDLIYDSIFMTNLILQEFVVFYIPYIGFIIAFLLSTINYSFFIFDYKWSYLQVKFTTRLKIFNKFWLYFLGFGLIPTIISITLPHPFETVVPAVLAPLYLIMIIRLNESRIFKTRSYFRFDPFEYPIILSNFVVISLIKLRAYRQKTSDNKFCNFFRKIRRHTRK